MAGTNYICNNLYIYSNQKIDIMDTKKTIFVSIATTLATLFVVATIVHICRGHCGNRGNNCHASGKHFMYKAKCGGQSSCASFSHCSKKKGCKSDSSCSAQSSCSGKSKCSKGSSCSSKTTCSKGKNGEQVIKKVVKIEEEEN